MHKLRGLGPLVLISILLTGCGSSNAVSTTSNINSDATINVQFGLEPTSLDLTTTSGAATGQILIGNVYEGLVSEDLKGNFSPALAMHWTISSDGLTYLFDLRKATFHDGSSMTANDVVTSFNESLAKGTVRPDANLLTSVQSVTAPDSQHVEFKLKKRDINLLDALATSGAGMVIKKTSGVNLNQQDNGTKGRLSHSRDTTGTGERNLRIKLLIFATSPTSLLRQTH